MMNDKELKYRKSIEEFIFVAESSTEIICDIVTNELSLNEHYKEKTEVRSVSYTHLTLPTICSV